MLKLSDIIKSGGGNAKINRFINRYVLSKKEKKDIVNEIKTKGSSSGGNSSKYAPRYFSIDWSKCSEEWSKIFDCTNDTYIALQPFASVKIETDEITQIMTYGVLPGFTNLVKSFSYIPCYCISPGISDVLTFEQCIESINGLLPQMSLPTLTLEGITEITEEEYYKID